MPLKSSPITRSIISALIGFIIYGTWAYIVNYSAGQETALIAATTQGSFSFIITLILTALMEYLYKYLSHFRYENIFTIILTCIILYISSYSINYFAGTPSIFFTILPGAVISSIYVWAYVVSINRLSTK